MKDHDDVIEAAHALASAIARRDEQAIAGLLHTDFALRTPGGESVDARTFVSNVGQIPGDILFVRLDGLHIDMTESGALVTGVQHARVRVDGNEVDDRRPFIDWFVQADDGAWRVKIALDLPGYTEG